MPPFPPTLHLPPIVKDWMSSKLFTIIIWDCLLSFVYQTTPDIVIDISSSWIYNNIHNIYRIIFIYTKAYCLQVQSTVWPKSKQKALGNIMHNMPKPEKAEGVSFTSVLKPSDWVQGTTPDLHYWKSWSEGAVISQSLKLLELTGIGPGADHSRQAS